MNTNLFNYINPRLPFILSEIYILLEKIKLCSSEHEAKIYFDILQNIQNILATLMFREEIEVNDEIAQFVRDCERLDDPWLRDYLFIKIKNNEYSLN